MDIKELRIGNIVKVDNKKYHPQLIDIPLIVTGITSCQDVENNSTYGVSLEHLDQDSGKFYDTYNQFIKFVKPIRITEDWLLKFGFEEFKEYSIGHGYKLNNISIRIDNFGFHYLYGIGVNSRLKYIHQLQNLYFALTGKELELTN